LELDPHDVEYSYLKQKLIKKIKVFSEDGSHALPTLKDLTNLTHEVIVEDLETLISQVVDTKSMDYAVLTGIMVHAPNGKSFIWPGQVYAHVEGKRVPLDFKAFSHHHTHTSTHHHHTTPPASSSTSS